MRRDPAGFTLTEILIATMLLVTVVAFLLSAFVNAAIWTRPQPNVAALLVRQKIENLFEHVRQDWYRTGVAACEMRAAAYGPVTMNLDGSVYERSHTVTQPSGRQYRKLSVQTSWT